MIPFDYPYITSSGQICQCIKHTGARRAMIYQVAQKSNNVVSTRDEDFEQGRQGSSVAVNIANYKVTHLDTLSLCGLCQ